MRLAEIAKGVFLVAVLGQMVVACNDTNDASESVSNFFAQYFLNPPKSQDVVSNNEPNVTIDTPVENVTISVGERVDFSGTGVGLDGNLSLSYLWNFGDPAIADSHFEDPGLIQFNTSGTYLVTLTIQDTGGRLDVTPATRYVHVLDNAPGGLISQKGWSLKYVDSEEVNYVYKPAINAFDGDPSTIWHTQWYSAAPRPPHEIQINLGKLYDINGFRYLPVQGGAINGRIDQYAFYVSSDGNNWGVPVAHGIFDNSPFEKEILFPVTTAKFIRLVALSEVNDMPYTSVAEINILGGVFSGNHPPESSIDTPSANITISVGDSVFFTGTGTDLDGNLPLSYLWDFGDPVIAHSVAEDPGYIKFKNAGTYVVKFTTVDALGRSDSAPATRVINVEVNNSDFLLSQAGWSLQYVDSEELVGVDGAATNAFDGNSATIWHTEWLNSNPPPPHEVQLDLGSAYEIFALHYLPRQDGETNGIMTEYEVYVSRDGINWGAPVATGTLAGDNSEKQIVIAPTIGQFIAVVALKSVNNQPWISAAEINVKGRCDIPYVKILQPKDYALYSSSDITIAPSVCLNDALHKGWGVKFTMDESIEYRSYSPPYWVTFSDSTMAEHVVRATIIDDNGDEVGGLNTQDQVVHVGVGDYYVAIGDSITAGVGDNFMEDNISYDGRNAEGGFTPILDNLLTGTKGYPHTVAMEAIPGSKSSEGLAWLPTVLSRHPNSQYFLILYGTNDAGGLFPVTPTTFKSNLQKMINMIKSSGKKAYLSKIPYSLDSGLNNMIQQYNVVIDRLVIDNNIVVIPPDFYSYFKLHQDELSDSVHPDGRGYQAMARLWQSTLQ